ncbi:FtsW/RodA/SpoVE family cell cycle protein [Pontibacillus sp. HMF3514]|uniref:FtsW/RodA/SpoVE family cell cycle protein n=1 Tax=Pontibacillus sp. HMF3514 TaxID=2692425 RepID=UPI0013200BF0|nr:FtsW/RodA/SpoVE family cell cycle protein [Pontibacillus sp. HMF3514]QHE51475.1 FtsW/RodA/SpoVE family cell cycle protein [Pontibacillus sp. HMF3514]
MSKNQGINLDFTLIMIVLGLACVSFFALYTITPSLPSKYDGSNFLEKQIFWYGLGSFVIAMVMLIDYDRLRQFAWFIYGFGVLLLLMLELNIPATFVHGNNGAVSWFKFPGIGTVQPGEFMKVFLVIIQSHIIVRHNEKRPVYRGVKDDLWLLAKIIGVALPPMALIAKQPDLGTFLVLAAITGALILVSGIRWRILLTITGAISIIASVIIFMFILFPNETEQILVESNFGHVTERFYGWLQPEEYKDYGYQLIRAMMAIGSGQLLGKGLMDMQVYIPERHTDMIFTAIAEQFGFIGASLVLTLFFLLIYRIIHTALESNDPFGSYLCVGMIGMFTYQIFQNIGMSIKLLPITGLPLPFLSYGGSSTLTYLIAIGIILNVRSRTKSFMFD